MSRNTRENILQAARQLFIEQGFTATSIRQIAETAVIGKATIYHHFSDKQAILLALLDQELTRDTHEFDAARAEPDPRRRIEIAVQISMRTFQQSMDVIQVAQRELPQVRARLHAEYHTFWQEHTALLSGAITQGQEQGLFRDVDPTEASRMLTAMVFGLFNSAYVRGEPMPTPEEGTAVLLDIFFKGIEK